MSHQSPLLYPRYRIVGGNGEAKGISHYCIVLKGSKVGESRGWQERSRLCSAIFLHSNEPGWVGVGGNQGTGEGIGCNGCAGKNE